MKAKVPKIKLSKLATTFNPKQLLKILPKKKKTEEHTPEKF
jgi:hypothetical protein